MRKLAILSLLGILLAFGGTAVFSQAYGAPMVQTGGASNIGADSATLNGQVNSNGYQTDYYFEYGTTSALGSVGSYQTINNGYSNNSVYYSVIGLSNNSTYYYKLTATNAFGTTQGAILSFTTSGNSYGGTGLSVTTNAATDITYQSAVLWAYAGTSEIYRGLGSFEYWADNNYSINTTNSTIIQTSSYYRTSENSPYFSSQITGLMPDTKYYFRAVLKNNNYSSYGQTSYFTTQITSLNYNYISTYNPNNYYTYTPPTTYQYVYQQPSVVYVDENGDPYNFQNANTTNISSEQGNQYYAPYYGMQTTIPPGQNSGLSATIIGAVGSFNGSSLFGGILFTALIVLIITGFLKGAF
jgi:hypothetical protein